MNCEEFLKRFREALDGKVPESVVQDNVNYYRSYIDNQTACGRNEEDVLKMLGDPRLLAKTIEESSKFASEGRDGYESIFGTGGPAKNRENVYEKTADEKQFAFSKWISVSFMIVLAVVTIVVLLRVFIFAAPYIAVFLLAGFIARIARSWWHTR